VTPRAERVVYGRQVTRVRAVVLLVLGCSFAAAGASTGAFLEDDALARPFIGRRRLQPLEIPEPNQHFEPAAFQWAGFLLEIVVVLLLSALLLYVLYRLALVVARLARLRIARSDAGEHTDEYDPGDESHEDAETVLRRRVAEELRLLSLDLEAEVEPREAVIACYVRMEAALAGAGAGRAPSETPLELVARVLDSFDVPPADVRRLTDLFTEARFSRHPVTDEMRAAARRSLSAVAGALEGVRA
jgi:hypothetical protein